MLPPDPMLLQAFGLLNAGQEQEALALFRQLAERQDPGALATLAELNWQGGLVPQNFAAGRDFYHRAGEAGHVGSAIYATNLLAHGYVGERNWGEAMARLRYEAGHDPARAEIAALLAALPLTEQGDPATLPRGDRVSESPDILLFKDAFSKAECDYLIRISEPDFQRARVLEQHSGTEKIDPIRTADEAHIHWLNENPLIHAFNRRLAVLSGTQADRGEPLQILRYRPGQHYLNHLDYINGAANQRVKTALIYLNEAYLDGETNFPRLGKKVRGWTGTVLVFRNALPDGRADQMSEHAGLPVGEGTKYLASRWIRERTFVSP
jgi:prolyl 4-hydroxylase